MRHPATPSRRSTLTHPAQNPGGDKDRRRVRGREGALELFEFDGHPSRSAGSLSRRAVCQDRHEWMLAGPRLSRPGHTRLFF